MRRTLVAVALVSSFGFASPSGLLDTFWSRLALLLNATEEGCGMDPDGRCMPDPQLKEGCGMDPNGRPNCS